MENNDLQKQCINCGILPQFSSLPANPLTQTVSKLEYHPFVAIIRQEDEFISKPICYLCWSDPQKRKGLKAHYCFKHQEKKFLKRAGSNNLKGNY